MKLPALWMLAAFAAGIGIAERWPGSLRLWMVAALIAILLGAALGALAGAGFVRRHYVCFAWICALAAWLALGGLARGVEFAGIPSNHITRLIAADKIDTSVALRWRGRLREDPLALPWGERFEIDLEQVEAGRVEVPVSGGLRVNFYSNERAVRPPEGLWAGDRVEALVKARPPRDFLDPGAFDVRGFLARQKIDLIGSLRSGALLQLVDRPAPTLLQRLARARGTLLARIDSLFVEHPERGAILRAMLLGDRSFVDSSVVLAFQKTAAYHVLVVAGLHVGALVIFLLWIGRRLRLPVSAIGLLTVIALIAYVGIVQDRPPILRAALMAALYLCARPLFRRVDLLQTIAVAALAILIWKPSSLMDSSFQLSFLAAGVIAGLALPWIDRTSAPYRAGLNHLGDVTRDTAYRRRSRSSASSCAERFNGLQLARRRGWLRAAARYWCYRFAPACGCGKLCCFLR
ncbi:MAG: ComEC/Rec2 family competence protein [Candidatus Acidiferrales bacterium]